MIYAHAIGAIGVDGDGDGVDDGRDPKRAVPSG